ncbi:MAG: GTPase domain-containing protein, partial [Deltaproteobacteria bacterium]|nr:GTPase domain-containing protein [Deltaproteobacteria bacterium]
MNYQGRPTRKNSDPVTGLTVKANEIEDLAKDLFKRLAVFFYKQQMSCLWIAFIGGTGTGKSTLFNAFCGKHLSKTGVERPKTPIIRDFPFSNIKLKNQGLDDPSTLPSAGLPGHLLVFTHNRQDWPHLVLLDTPDMDSVETANQKIVEDFYLLSDAVVFVTSQEKYADDVPYQFLLKIGQDEKPCFLLVNKAYEHLTREEILEPLQSQGTSFPKDKMWLIPYSSSKPEQSIMEDSGFRSFVSDFLSQLSPQHTESFHSNQQSKRTRDLTTRIERLIRLLKKENDEAQNWLSQLEDLCKESCHDLIETEKRRFATESRQYLQREIRKLFTKYDPLAKPRRIIRQILFTPFRLLG